jgi:hypothetical protein
MSDTILVRLKDQRTNEERLFYLIELKDNIESEKFSIHLKVIQPSLLKKGNLCWVKNPSQQEKSNSPLLDNYIIEILKDGVEEVITGIPYVVASKTKVNMNQLSGFVQGIEILNRRKEENVETV